MPQNRDLFKPGEIAFYILLPLVVLFVSLFIGRYPVSISDAFNALLTPAGLNWRSIPHTTQTIVLHSRLPRAVVGALVGGALASCGVAFQGVFRNPMVSSGFMGVSSGASFGASLSIILSLSSTMTYLSAFFFGVIAVIASYFIGSLYSRTNQLMFILGGIIVQSLFSGLVSLLKYIADPANQLPTIVFWLMGSLANLDYAQFFALIPIVVGMIGIFLMRWQINLLSMGEKEAQSLGVSTKKSTLLLIGFATLATAGAVCISGTIGWIGLVIPHIGRLIVGNDNRRLVPFSMSLGGSFLIVIDVISRNISSAEVPLGILTSIIGTLFFIFLLYHNKGKRGYQ